MKKTVILFVFLLVFGCGSKVESDKVVEIIYPSDNMEFPEEFYVLAASVKWRDTFIFNPFLFGRVSEVKTEGIEGTLIVDGKVYKKGKRAKHHFFKLNLSEGKHQITFKTNLGKSTVSINVKKDFNPVFEKALLKIEEKKKNIVKAIKKNIPLKDKNKIIDEQGFRLIDVVINSQKALLIWKKIYGYTSFFKFSLIDIKDRYTKKDLTKTLNIPEEYIYGDAGEVYLSGLDVGKNNAVVSCGDGFLFRFLKEKTVSLMKVSNDGTTQTIEISLYKYADKNDKLMTPAYKYPNYYYIACNHNYKAVFYPVYGDYNLDYKAVILEKSFFKKSHRFTDFDNFKLKPFLLDTGEVIFHKIPDRILTNEKHRLYFADETIKEILFPLPFEKEYVPIDKAYVNIKGKYYPPTVKTEGYVLDKLYLKTSIFGKKGLFKVSILKK